WGIILTRNKKHLLYMENKRYKIEKVAYSWVLPPMLKYRLHSKTMNKNGLNIQTISTKRTDFQTDCVLLLGQLTEKEEKSLHSHFLKFPLSNQTNGTFGFAQHTSSL